MQGPLHVATSSIPAPLLDDQERQQLRKWARDSAASWRNEALDEYVRLRTEFDAIRGDRSNVDYRTIEDSLDSALFALAPRPREYWTTMRGYHCWSWWLAWLVSRSARR